MLADLIDWSKLEKVEWTDKNLYVSCDSCVFGVLTEACGDLGVRELCSEGDTDYIFIKKEQADGGVE